MLPGPFMRAARPSYSVAITRALVFAGIVLLSEAKAQVPFNKYKPLHKKFYFPTKQIKLNKLKFSMTKL